MGAELKTFPVARNTSSLLNAPCAPCPPVIMTLPSGSITVQAPLRGVISLASADQRYVGFSERAPRTRSLADSKTAIAMMQYFVRNLIDSSPSFNQGALRRLPKASAAP